MHCLLISRTMSSETHGPARFARFVAVLPQHFPDHQISILTEEPIPSDTARLLAIRVIYPQWLEAFNPLIRAWKYFRALRRIVRDQSIDVLLFNHAIHAFFCCLWLRRVPIVVMINDDLQLQYRRVHGPLNRKRYSRGFYQIIERWVARRAARTIVNSDYLKQEVLRTYHPPQDRLHLLYKGIDVHQFPFVPERAFSGVLCIIFVKSDFRTGGLASLIRALNLLVEYRFELTIIGPPVRLLKAASYPNQEHVIVRSLGHQPNLVVRRELIRADIFCVPSLREGLGVANMEALAAGCPVVATKVGGIPEVMDQGRNGWMAPANNPEELAQVLRACTEQPEERLRRARQGREYVEKYFDYRQMLSNLLQILEPLCA